MSYKIATKEKFRFLCSKGNLTTEQLWDLSIEDLRELETSLSVDDSEKNRLKLDVVLDILNTKN